MSDQKKSAFDDPNQWELHSSQRDLIEVNVYKNVNETSRLVYVIVGKRYYENGTIWQYTKQVYRDLLEQSKIQVLHALVETVRGKLARGPAVVKLVDNPEVPINKEDGMVETTF